VLVPDPDPDPVPEKVWVSEVVCDMVKTMLRRMNATIKRFFILRCEFENDLQKRF